MGRSYVIAPMRASELGDSAATFGASPEAEKQRDSSRKDNEALVSRAIERRRADRQKQQELKAKETESAMKMGSAIEDTAMTNYARQTGREVAKDAFGRVVPADSEEQWQEQLKAQETAAEKATREARAKELQGEHAKKIEATDFAAKQLDHELNNPALRAMSDTDRAKATEAADAARMTALTGLLPEVEKRIEARYGDDKAAKNAALAAARMGQYDPDVVAEIERDMPEAFAGERPLRDQIKADDEIRTRRTALEEKRHAAQGQALEIRQRDPLDVAIEPPKDAFEAAGVKRSLLTRQAEIAAKTDDLTTREQSLATGYETKVAEIEAGYKTAVTSGRVTMAEHALLTAQRNASLLEARAALERGRLDLAPEKARVKIEIEEFAAMQRRFDEPAPKAPAQPVGVAPNQTQATPSAPTTEDSPVVADPVVKDSLTAAAPATVATPEAEDSKPWRNITGDNLDAVVVHDVRSVAPGEAIAAAEDAARRMGGKEVYLRPDFATKGADRFDEDAVAAVKPLPSEEIEATKQRATRIAESVSKALEDAADDLTAGVEAGTMTPDDARAAFEQRQASGLDGVAAELTEIQNATIGATLEGRMSVGQMRGIMESMGVKPAQTDAMLAGVMDHQVQVTDASEALREIYGKENAAQKTLGTTIKEKFTTGYDRATGEEGGAGVGRFVAERAMPHVRLLNMFRDSTGILGGDKEAFQAKKAESMRAGLQAAMDQTMTARESEVAAVLARYPSISDEDATRIKLSAARQALATSSKGLEEVLAGIAESPESKLPFVGDYVATAMELAPVIQAVMKAKDGQELSEADEFFLEAYIEDAGRDHTVLGLAGEILTEMPAFMGEIYLTGGVGTAARKGTGAAARKIVGEEIAGAVTKWAATRPAAVRFLGRGVASVYGTTAQTPLAMQDRIATDILTKMTIPDLEGFDGDTQAWIKQPGMDFGPAMGQASFDAWTEMIAETSGPLISAIGKGAGKVIPAGLRNRLAKASWVKAAAKLNNTVSTSAIGKFARRANFGGPIEEILEERVGDVISATGNWISGGAVGEEFKLPTADQWAAEAIAMTIPNAAFAVANARSTAQAKKASRALFEQNLAPVAAFGDWTDPTAVADGINGIMGGDATAAPFSAADIEAIEAEIGPLAEMPALVKSREIDQRLADRMAEAENLDDMDALGRASSMRISRARHEAGKVVQTVIAHRQASQAVATMLADPAPEMQAEAARVSGAQKIAAGRPLAELTAAERAVWIPEPTVLPDGSPVVEPALVEEVNGKPVITDTGKAAVAAVLGDQLTNSLLPMGEAKARRLALQPERKPQKWNRSSSSPSPSPSPGSSTSSPTPSANTKTASATTTTPARTEWRGRGANGTVVTLPADAATSLDDAERQMATLLPLGEMIEPDSVEPPSMRRGEAETVGGGDAAVETSASSPLDAVRSRVDEIVTKHSLTDSHRVLATGVIDRLENLGAEKVFENIDFVADSDVGLEVKGSTLRVNLEKLGTQTKGPRHLDAVVAEEVVHGVAVNTLDPAAVAELWQSLPAALKRTVLAAYRYDRRGLKGGEQGDLSDFNAGHEFLRMVVQDRAFKGMVSEAMAEDAGFAKQLLDLLRQLVDALRRHVGSLAPEVRGEVEQSVEAIISGLEGLGVRVERTDVAAQAPSPKKRAARAKKKTSPDEADVGENPAPLSEGWQKAADAFEGLYMGRALDSLAQSSLPAERLGKFVEAASALIAEGIRTPQALAEGLDRLAPGGKLRQYSQAFWDAFGMVDNTLRATHDWDAVYNPEPAADAAEGESEEEDPAETKFIGNMEAGEILVSGSIEVKGNFDRKKTAEALADSLPGGSVEPYLNGKYNRGWVVLQDLLAQSEAPVSPLAPVESAIYTGITRTGADGAILRRTPAGEYEVRIGNDRTIMPQALAAATFKLKRVEIEALPDFQPPAEETPPTPTPDPVEPSESSDWWRAAVPDWTGRIVAGEDIYWKVEKAKAKRSGAEAKEIDEAIEYAFTRAAKQIAMQATTGASPREIFASLVGLHNRQPTLTAKTSTSKINQAYSTPAPMAWVAEVLVNNSPSQILAEPAAGNGMLLIGASSDQTVYANEIDPRRRAKLEDQFGRDQQLGQVSGVDAVEWTPPTPPTRVIANPPFGQLMDEGGKNRVFTVPYGDTTQIDFAIMLQSLETMAPEGRGTFIIGGPPPTVKTEANKAKHYGGGGKGRFFSHLYGNYNVIDHFTVSGELYAKQGAGWPVDFITVAGRGQSRKTLPGARPPRTIETWEDLASELERTDDERIDINRLTEDELRDDAGKLADGLAAIGQRPARGADSAGESRDVDAELGDRAADDAGRDRGDGIRDRPSPADTARPGESRPGDGIGQSRSETGNTAADVGVSGRVESAPAPSRAEAGSDYQTAYEPVSGVNPGGLLAPVNLAGPMRSALDRLQSEVGDLPTYVSGKLGYPEGTDITQYFFGDQIDALAQAIHQVETGGALVVGDQTGTGKGRVVAGLMKYAIKEGRVPVFVTKDQTLYDAMMDDLSDIEAPEVSPLISDQEIKEKTLKDKLRARNGLNGRKAYEQLYQTGEMPVGTNAMFLSYPQISSDTPTNLDPLVRAQARNNGEAPPGYWRMDALRSVAPRALFIFDESHLASGASTTGFRIGELLAADGSQVYYSSATFAKRPDNMGLYFRTNLGQAAGSIGDLMKLMTDGGVPAMQVASSMLAQDGQYLRRERSFAGVRFETVILSDSYERDKALADNYTEGLRAILDVQNRMSDAAAQINAMVAKVGKKWDVPTGQRIRLEAENFSAKLHNMVRQYLFAIKADETARRAVVAIRDGHPDTNGVVRPHKVIVAVENTMESGIKSLRDGGFPLTFNGMLEYFLDRQRTFVVSKGAFGKGRVEWTLPKVGNPEFADSDSRALQNQLVYTTQAADGQLVVNVREEVLKELSFRAMNGVFLEAEEKVKAMNLSEMPLSPIDHMRQVVEAAGIRTAEMTGRSEGIDADGRIYTRDPEEVKGRLAAKDAFNNGPVDFLIINKSGSTGVSMHASPKFQDTRPRLMFVAQPNLDINEFMQTLGRIHRAGQVETPSYALVQAALPAEKRPAAILGAKMSMLNANTTSNADSEVSQKEGVDLFNKYGDGIVHSYLGRNYHIANQVNASWGKLLNDKGELYPVAHFASAENGGDEGYLSRSVTGHLAILTVEEQEDFWSAVEDEYRSLITYLDEIGQNDLRATVMDLRAKTVSTRLFTPGTGGDSVFSEPSYLETAEVKLGKKPPEWEETSAAAEKASATARDRQAAYLSLAEKWITAEEKRKAPRALNWEKKRERWLSESQDSRRRIASAVGMIGSFGTYKRGDGTLGWAWVADVEIDDAKPVTPSSQSVIAMVNDGKVRMRVPLSQFDEFFSLQTFGAADGWQSTYDFGSSRQIVTGNLIDAISDLGKTGQIISYTTEGGETRMGILLPAGYTKAEERSSARNTPVRNAEEFQAALASGQEVFSDAVRFRRTPESSSVDFIVPASRSAGGKYWRDPIINRQLIGGEFVERGGRMVGRVDYENTGELFTYLTGTLNETLSTARGTTEEGQSLAMGVDLAARRTETNPTEGQKKAGNYKMGKVTIQGLPISIENPRGSARRGRDASGKEWSVEMAHHYGYIRAFRNGDKRVTTEGKDGDHVDVFIGPDPEQGMVYVVNQVKANGHFDEHKVMLGFDSAAAAAKGYRDSYSPGWKGLGSMVPVSIDGFKAWLESGDMGKPFAASDSLAMGANSAAEADPRGTSDEAAIRNALDYLSGKLPSAKVLNDRRGEAIAEAEGERTIGNPEIANIFEGDRDRREFDVIREAYELSMKGETHEQWNESANRLVKRDPEGVIRSLVEAAREGVAIDSPVMVKAAQILVPRIWREALASGDTKSIRDAQSLMLAYQMGGTVTARALGARRDPFKSKEDRHLEFLADMISKVSPEVLKKAKAAPTPAKKSREIDRLERELAEARKNAADKSAIARLGKELTEMRKAKDRAEILGEAHEQRLARVEQVLAEMGVSLHDIFSHQAVVRLRGSEIVARVIEDNYSKPQRAAIRAIIQEQLSASQIKKKTGIPVAEVKTLKEDFMAKIKGRFLELAKRGLTLSDFQHTDAGMFNVGERISEEGDVLRMGYSSNVSDEAAEKAADEMMDALFGGPNGGKGGGSRPGGTSPKFDPGNREHVAQIGRIIQEPDGFDMVFEYWINNILGGPQTHATNIIGNGLNISLEYGLQRLLEAGWNQMVGDKTGATFGEYAWLQRAIPNAWKQGFKYAVQTWATEESFLERDVLNDPADIDPDMDKSGGSKKAIPDRIFGMGTTGAKDLPGAILDAAKGKGWGGVSVGKTVRIPGRALLFMDTLMKGVVGFMEVSGQAYRRGAADGLTGKKLEAYVRGEANTPGSESWHAAMMKANEMTFTTRLRGATVKEGQPGGMVEQLVKKLQEARRSGGTLGPLAAFMVGFIFPFIQTPFNIFKSGLRRTPFGLGGMAKHLLDSGLYTWKNGGTLLENYGKARLTRDLADQTISLMVTAILLGLTEGDDDDDDKPILVTGSRPWGVDSSGERGLLDRLEGGAFSIRLGKAGPDAVYFDYGRMEPFATIIASVADSVRSVKRMENGADKMAELTKMRAYALSQAQDKTFLQGIVKINELMNPSQSAGKNLARNVAQFIVPNIIRQPLRNLDDYVRETKTAPWYYHAVPLGGFAESKYDLYGQPLRKGGTAVQPLGGDIPDRFARVVVDTNLKPNDPRHPADLALREWNRRNPAKGDQYFPSDNSIYSFKDLLGQNHKLTARQLAEVNRQGGQRLALELAQIITPAETLNPTQETIAKIERARRAVFTETRDRIVKTPLPPRRPSRSLAELLGWDNP